MIIHRHGQLAAALGAPALEYVLAISCLHTIAKAMHTQAPMDLGLISPLRHYTFLSLPEISV